MTKPFLIAAFGCAILLAGAIPSLARDGGHGAPSSPGGPGGHGGESTDPRTDDAVLCIVGANCGPPILKVRHEHRRRAYECGRMADDYGLFGEGFADFVRGCEQSSEM